MFDLAQHIGEGPVSLKIIAQRQDLSEHYLEQLFSGLRKNGLVKSMRGAQGGYILGREPENIFVGEIIRALEGPLALVDCVAEENPESCHKADFCVTRMIWEKVRISIAGVIDSITLADMVADAASRQGESDLIVDQY
jgi:Rrf2 family protein